MKPHGVRRMVFGMWMGLLWAFVEVVVKKMGGDGISMYGHLAFIALIAGHYGADLGKRITESKNGTATG